MKAWHEKKIKEIPHHILCLGLAISFDMGWKKRSSGHKYDSISGHAFIIGAYTRRIIGSVVFSKSCAVCNQRKKMNSHADERGVTDITNSEIEKDVGMCVPCPPTTRTRRERDKIASNVIDTSGQDHPCMRNYDGSSGGMEIEGLLLLMKKLRDKTNGEIYLDYVITDDDT